MQIQYRSSAEASIHGFNGIKEPKNRLLQINIVEIF